MFGDHFGQRGDYTEGLFYAGRRKYLNDDGSSDLEPPDEFKSKRQLRELRKSRERDQATNPRQASFHIRFKKGDDDMIKRLKRAATTVKDVVTFELRGSIHPDEWREEFQAGVRMWVNKRTGDVAATCPWTLDEHFGHHLTSFEESTVDLSEYSVTLEDDETMCGTGALINDHISDVDSLYENLSRGPSRK
jgi:hypothetical protein